MRSRQRVLWGRGIQEALVGVSRLISDLNFNVGWYLRELGGYGSGKPEDMERLERYVYSMGPENDDFAKKLSAAVETVEEFSNVPKNLIGDLTSRWMGSGMRGEFGVIVVCSGWLGGWAEDGPGRSARGR